MRKIYCFFIIYYLFTSCRNEDALLNSLSTETTTETEIKKIDVKTHNPTFISQIQVDFLGEIIKNDTGQEILSYGMLLGDTINPTFYSNIGNQAKDYTNGDTIFSGSFFDLQGNKTYYLRFYVKTKTNIFYGESAAFISSKHKIPVENNIVLTTQQQVNDFGANDYTYVMNLTIGGSVSDLSPLSSLKKIGNTLEIKYTSNLTNLNGLQALQIIGTDVFPNGHVQILNNTNLQSLTGLDNLIFTGRLFVNSNPLLHDLQGLGKLTQVYHSTFLTVPSFDGLPLDFRTGEFESIGFLGTDLGNRKINCEAYYFTLKDAPNITTLNGFTIGNYQNTTALYIDNCNSLISLDQLILPNKYPEIFIFNCANFESFKGLENLIEVDVISVKNLPKLKNFQYLENITKLEGLGIENSGVNSFFGLQNVTWIESFKVKSSNSLLNFNGLSSLNKIGNSISYFDVYDCANLQNFTGLENVTHFTRFNISNLPQLNSFNGIGTAAMPYISIVNCNMNSLQGLNNVFGVNNIGIYDNQNLQNFCAIKNVVGNVNGSNYYVNNNLQNPTNVEIINNCP